MGETSQALRVLRYARGGGSEDTGSDHRLVDDSFGSAAGCHHDGSRSKNELKWSDQ